MNISQAGQSAQRHRVITKARIAICAHPLRHPKSPLTASQVSEAVGAFLDRGGLIRRLPDEPTPPRGMAEGDAANYAVFEDCTHALQILGMEDA